MLCVMYIHGNMEIKPHVVQELSDVQKELADSKRCKAKANEAARELQAALRQADKNITAANQVCPSHSCLMQSGVCFVPAWVRGAVLLCHGPMACNGYLLCPWQHTISTMCNICHLLNSNSMLAMHCCTTGLMLLFDVCRTLLRQRRLFSNHRVTCKRLRLHCIS